MRTEKILLIFFVFTSLLFSCNRKNEKEDSNYEGHDHSMNHPENFHKKIYICPMDPQIIQDKPGICPICKMDLVEKTEQSGGKKLNLGAIVEPVNETVLSSVETIKPINKSLTDVVNAQGYISYNPQNASTISSRYSGRIDKLYVKYNFQEVKKGQKIMEIYSPDLLTAQQNLIYLLNNDSTATQLIQSATERLKLLGMSDEQIREIKRTKKSEYLVSVYSPVSGHIHEMNSISEITMPVMEMMKKGKDRNPLYDRKELSVKEGAYVDKGQTIFNIVSTTKVWAILQIYPNDVSKIKLNQPVEIIPENTPGSSIKSTIGFIEPFYEDDSKYLGVRVYLNNINHHELKIGTLVKGKISTGKHDGIWIPESSVIDLGNDVKVVFIKSGKVFKAQRVFTGEVIGEEIKVMDGLTEEDELAANAHYLVDSQSFIQLSDSIKE